MSLLPLNISIKKDTNGSFHSVSTVPLKRNLSSLSTESDKTYTLFLFSMLSYLTIASALAVGIAEIVLMLASSAVSWPSVLVRLYGVALAIGVVLAELEWTEAVRTFQLVQNWVSRGFLYIFVGLLAMDNDNENLDSSSAAFVFYSSLSLVLFGLSYSFLGVLCCKKFKDEKMAKYIQLLSHLEVQSAISRSASAADHSTI